MDRMSGFGLTLSDAKRTEILDYLNANLASTPAQPAAPQARRRARSPDQAAPGRLQVKARVRSG